MLAAAWFVRSRLQHVLLTAFVLLLPLLPVQARADFAAASDRLQETEVKLMNAQADAKAVAAQLEAAQKEQAQLMACVEQREKVRPKQAAVCWLCTWQQCDVRCCGRCT